MRRTIFIFNFILLLFFLVLCNSCNTPASDKAIEVKDSTDKEKVLKLKLSGKPEIEWASIPEGTFMMGAPAMEAEREKDETPHQVTISAFRMSKYEVTFDQYDAFCEATGREKPGDEDWGRGRRPVINVSWDDANAFASWLGCRLPTEAEWEYACRAGTSTNSVTLMPFNTGDNLTTTQANYDGYISYNGNGYGVYRLKTIPVGSFAPNAWGLYDMHGNVCEWCSDWYGKYSNTSQTDPKGPASGIRKVLRGGSWCARAGRCRSAFRDGTYPESKISRCGIRLVQSQ